MQGGGQFTPRSLSWPLPYDSGVKSLQAKGTLARFQTNCTETQECEGSTVLYCQGWGENQAS